MKNIMQVNKAKGGKHGQSSIYRIGGLFDE